MKVLALSRYPEQLLIEPPAIEIIVDSATVSVPRPIFLPDFDSDWCIKAYPAFKISRLGKDIDAQFASRYFNSFTIALRLFPKLTDAWLNDNNLPKGVLGIFDYCLGLGEWHRWDEDRNSLKIRIKDAVFSLTGNSIAIDKVIELVSHYTTLKTGDVILPCELPLSFPVKAGEDISIDVDGFPPFDFKIR